MKVTTKYSREMMKEFYRERKIISLILMILSLVYIIAGIAVNFFFENSKSVQDFLIFCGVFLFIYCLIFFISMQRTIKNMDAEGVVWEYEFFDDHLIVHSRRFEEEVLFVKLYYSRVKKIEETKNYLFIFQTVNTFFPIDKRGVEESEISSLRERLRKGIEERKKKRKRKREV